MDTSELNKYIDFNKIFYDIVDYFIENQDLLNQTENNLFEEILSFYRDLKIDSLSNSMEINKDECSLQESHIWFTYSASNNDSNECTSMSSYTVVEIMYNRDDEVFSYFSSENG